MPADGIGAAARKAGVRHILPGSSSETLDRKQLFGQSYAASKGSRANLGATASTTYLLIKPDVRFGPKADMTLLDWDVCFTPNSGHRATGLQCPLYARSGHGTLGHQIRIFVTPNTVCRPQ
jgi:hypothetical protein